MSMNQSLAIILVTVIILAGTIHELFLRNSQPKSESNGNISKSPASY